jgi:cation-transporting P-type ATPase C
LIKGGQYIELLATADTLVLDKTGTLTAGRPAVAEVVCLAEAVSESSLVALAAAAEQGAQHPLGQAVLEHAEQLGVPLPRHEASETVLARGTQTRVDRQTIRVGSERFMAEAGIRTDGEIVRHADRLLAHGRHVLYVAREQQLLGLIGVEDELREDMKKALNRLRNLHVDEIVLLTGDRERAAEVIATRLAMDGYEANVLPADKADLVLSHRISGDRVVMVGDGINDGPALAHADVGIAMGTSRTDLAMEAADIVIASDDALMLPATVGMAKHTMAIIRQNFGTAIGVNTVGLVLGAMGVLSSLWGAVLHNATTVAVVANSGRLLFHRMLER